MLKDFGLTEVHEAGHAVVAWHSPTILAVDKVCTRVGPLTQLIIGVSGFTLTASICPGNDPIGSWDDIAINIASVAAIRLAYGCRQPFGGAAADIATAFSHAYWLTAMGFGRPSASPWIVDAGRIPPDRNLWVQINLNIPEQIRPLIDLAYMRAIQVIVTERRAMRLLCATLQGSGFVSGKDEIRRLLGPRPADRLRHIL